MNRTKIEWTNWTWNPIVGCNHGCWYCYARKMCMRFPKVFPNGFKPTFHPERLGEILKLKTPAKIFACSISDLFAPWTPFEWRDAVLEAIEKCPVKHTFQLLTKNPERIPYDREFPENVWVGTTVTGENSDTINIEAIKRVKANRFVSFEPLLAKIEFGDYATGDLSLEGIDWAIVGKLTGSRKVKLQGVWLSNIMFEVARLGIPLFMKNNLLKDFPDLKLIQKFPEGMA